MMEKDIIEKIKDKNVFFVEKGFGVFGPKSFQPFVVTDEEGVFLDSNLFCTEKWYNKINKL